jgi:hypothetical protein
MAHEMQTPAGSPGYGGSYGVPPDAREGRGWLTFAAVLFFAAGLANGLWGIAALANDNYFTVDELLFGDLSMWGVFYLALAALQFVVGYLILRRSPVGAVIGIGLALLHGLVALMSIGAYPLWTVIVLVLDGLIIYGLTVYGFGEA